MNWFPFKIYPRKSGSRKRFEGMRNGNGFYNKKPTLEERIDQANKIHNFKYDYSLISEYVRAHDKVKVICPEHGEFEITWDKHINFARGCPQCSDKKKYTKDFFVKEAKKVHGNKYDYSLIKDFRIGDVKVRVDKLPIICPKHGVFHSTIDNHLRGYGCKECGIEQASAIRKATFHEFKCRAREIHGDRYEYDEGTFNGLNKKMRMICSRHGEFYQLPSKHLQGHGCQKCKNSHLEEDIMLYLDKNGIEYKIQYGPDFLKHGKGLQRLDFFLPKFNVGIECQGIQHFIDSPYRHLSDVKKTQERDIIKKRKCEENGIELIYYTAKEYIKYMDKCSIYNVRNLYSDVDDTMNRVNNILNDKPL